MIRLINGFISKSDCDFIVQHIDHLWDNMELEPRGLLKHRLMRYNDPVINPMIKSYSERAKHAAQVYMNPGFELHTTDYGLFVSHENYEMAPHIDSINDNGAFSYLKYAAVIYLNDEYEGGSIYFPNQNQEYFPSKGDAIVFPANDMSYLHGVSKVKSGNRYTLAFWFSEDGEWEKYFE